MPSGIGGDQCQAGYYCPAGAYQPIRCDPGSYCSGPGLSNTSGLCLPGYFCSGGAYIPNPTDGNVTGTGFLITVCVSVFPYLGWALQSMEGSMLNSNPHLP